ncbi:hypothetical protein LTR95_002027 [Oleoguttula sp. CCFEE 5521]
MRFSIRSTVVTSLSLVAVASALPASYSVVDVDGGSATDAASSQPTTIFQTVTAPTPPQSTKETTVGGTNRGNVHIVLEPNKIDHVNYLYIGTCDFVNHVDSIDYKHPNNFKRGHYLDIDYRIIDINELYIDAARADYTYRD